MDIAKQKTGDILVLRLTGRLDANWCDHVQKAIAAVVHEGEHRVHLDMAGVSYVSSAGLRVLLSFYKLGGSRGSTGSSASSGPRPRSAPSWNWPAWRC